MGIPKHYNFSTPKSEDRNLMGEIFWAELDNTIPYVFSTAPRQGENPLGRAQQTWAAAWGAKTARRDVRSWPGRDATKQKTCRQGGSFVLTLNALPQLGTSPKTAEPSLVSYPLFVISFWRTLPWLWHQTLGSSYMMLTDKNCCIGSRIVAVYPRYTRHKINWPFPW